MLPILYPDRQRLPWEGRLLSPGGRSLLDLTGADSPPSPVGGCTGFRNEFSEDPNPLAVMRGGGGDRHSHYDKLRDGNPGRFLVKDGSLCEASRDPPTSEVGQQGRDLVDR